jgi:hypothetical protein
MGALPFGGMNTAPLPSALTRSMSPRRLALLSGGFLLAGAAVLAGCGTSPSPQAGGSPVPMPSWERISCSVAPTGTVAGSLGLAPDALDAPQETHNDPVTVCTFLQKSRASAVVVRLQSGVDATIFAGSKSGVTTGGQQATDISGLGDAAYSSTSTSGGTTMNTVAAWKGTVSITVTSTASVDKEKALVRQLLANLPAGASSGASGPASGGGAATAPGPATGSARPSR